MSDTNSIEVPSSSFFENLKKSSHKLLLLDFDGTLSPFVEDRFKAYPYPGVTNAIKEIMNCPNTRVVIITGRPLNEIIPLLNMSPTPEIWGSHGWQRLTTDGKAEDFPIPQEIVDILNTVRQSMEQKIPIEKLDIKPSSVAVHWRGLDEATRQQYEAHAKIVCTPYEHHDDVELQPFDGGLELRIKGRDKGTSVKALLAESPTGTFVSFLGDDKTDEDAFKALQGHGEGVLVKTKLRETLATYWIQPPQGLLDFLNKWQSACNS